MIISTNERFFKALKYTLIGVLILGACGLAYFKEFPYDILWVTIFSALVVFLFMTTISTDIDVKNLRYKQGICLFGKVLGNWQQVSKFSYVSIFPTLGKSEQMVAQLALSNFGDYKAKELKVNLIYNGNRRVQIKEGLKYGKAKKFAISTAKQFNLKVYDCVGKENVWIDPLQ